MSTFVKNSVRELEVMTALFDKQEVRIISKKRKEFDLKVQRRSNCKEDFLRYIQYEMALLKQVKESKEKSAASLKTVADAVYAITSRVDQLFQQVIQRFQKDVRIWTHYIKFCKNTNLTKLVSSLFARMLEVHSNKPDIWKQAAQWEFDKCNAIENSRNYLMRGLEFHPESKILWEEAFRQELTHFDMISKQKTEQLSDQAMKSVPLPTTSASSSDSETRAQVIFDAVVYKVHDIQFYIDLLNVAKQFDFTHKLQSNIVTYMVTKYRNEELAWETLARLELEGRYSELTADNKDAFEWKKPSLKKRITHCVTVYTATMNQLGTERMWSFYIETLVELNQDMTALPNFKQNLLLTALENAHNAKRLNEKYYLPWVDLLKLTEKFNKQSTVLRQATALFPTNIDLWLNRFLVLIAQGKEKQSVAVFDEAIANLGTEDMATLPFWKTLILYFQIGNLSEAKRVFEKGLNLGTNISSALKPSYLEWVLLMEGIQEVRKEYETLNVLPPPCMTLHRKMIDIEMMQADTSVKHLRRCYDNACQQFGTDNSALWIEYVEFESKNNDATFSIDSIYERATAALDRLQVDVFISEFTVIKSSLPTPMIIS